MMSLLGFHDLIQRTVLFLSGLGGVISRGKITILGWRRTFQQWTVYG